MRCHEDRRGSSNVKLFSIVLLLGIFGAANGATLPFILDGAPPGKDVSLTIPSSGSAILTVIRTATEGPENLNLHLSQFVGEKGNPIVVNLIVRGDKAKPGEMYLVKEANTPITLQLDVGSLPSSDKYSGTLTMVSDKYDTAIWRIVLTGGGVFRPATLVVDRGTLVVSTITCPFFYCFASPPKQTFLHLSDKSRQWPLEGITVRQEQAAKVSEFDIDRDLRFTFNGVSVPNIGYLSDKETRAAPRGQPATIGLEPVALPPGEYNAVLRFQAVNSGDDDAQKVFLTVFVRDCLFWAVVVLVVALLVSFLVTKVLVMLRQRLVFQKRILQLRPAWLASMNSLLPVVWARAMLRQADDLSKRFWLTGETQMDARLAQVGSVLDVLDKVRHLKMDFDRFPPVHQNFVKRRAISALLDVVSKMDASTMSAQMATQFKAELDALEAWKLKTEEVYWADLQKAAKELLATVDLLAIPDTGREAVTALIDDIRSKLGLAPMSSAPVPPNNAPTPPNNAPTPQKDLSAMLAVEDQYARLKVLWERRVAAEFDELLKLNQGRPLITLFKAADDAAWKRLGKAEPVVTLPQDTGADPLESYSPLIFKLGTPNDATLGDTYLFLHGLTYAWTFELKNAKGVSLHKFSAESMEPSVVAFAPSAGVLSAKVTVAYNGEKIEIKGEGVTIAKSSDYTIDKAFERAEMASFVIAGILALIGGLSGVATKPTFGTLWDYLGLFMLGVGADQLKNLAQFLQFTSPPKAGSGT